MSRQPNAQAYNLGHFEQMQVALAIQSALEQPSTALMPQTSATLRELLPLFNSGTTQIVHTPDGE